MRFIFKLSLILTLLITLIVGSSLAIIYFNQDDIEQLVIKEVNQILIQPVEIDDIEISAISNFPYTSITFNNINAIDYFGKDTLLNAEKLILKFNAIDLYNRNYNIQEIELLNGHSIIYYKNDTANFNIWRSDIDTTKNKTNANIQLNNVLLNNFVSEYKDGKNNFQTKILNKETRLSIKLNEDSTNLSINGNITVQSLVSEKIAYLNNNQVRLNGIISLNSDGQKINMSTKVEKLPFDISFSSSNKAMNLEINSPELNIVEVLTLTPKNYLKAIEGFDINGKSSLNLNYNKTSDSTPNLNINFDVNNISISSNYPYLIENSQFNGSYDARLEKVILNNFIGTINQDPIQGDFEITNFQDPSIKANFTTKFSLSELKKHNLNLPLKTLNGSVDLQMKYEGKIGAKNNYEFDISKAKKEAIISIKGFELKQEEKSPLLHNGKIDLKLIDDQLSINHLSLNIEEKSNLKFNGAIENVFKYYFLKNAPLRIGGNIESDWVLVDEIFTPDTTINDNTESEKINFPENITANLNLNITDFSSDRFHMRNFKSNLSYNNKILKARKIELETMSGKIFSDLSIQQVENENIRLISSSEMKEINVRQLFYEFHNFGQETMKHKHLIGVINSEIYFRNEWGPYFNDLKNKLYSFIDLEISNGQLLDFEPLAVMSSYISLDELKRIKFSTLENQIEIKDEKINIPFMEIHSSAIDIALSGTHHFNNEIDYDLKILLNEILSNKLKRKNKKKKTSEFGIVEDDGVKGLTMFMKMKGSVDDPIITPGTVKLRESLNKEFKKEKKEFKDVLKSEFKKDKQKEIENTNTDYNNIIEWED